MTNPVLLSNVASDVLTSGGVYGKIRIGESPTLAVVGTTALANRKLLMIWNTSNVPAFWGFDSGVTWDKGMIIPPNHVERIACTEAVTIYVVCAPDGITDIRVIEGA